VQVLRALGSEKRPGIERIRHLPDAQPL